MGGGLTELTTRQTLKIGGGSSLMISCALNLSYYFTQRTNNDRFHIQSELIHLILTELNRKGEKLCWSRVKKWTSLRPELRQTTLIC